MKRCLTNMLLFALVAGVVPQFASAQATSRPTVADMNAEEVRRLNSAEVEAFVQRDPKAMARLWSDDFVVTNPSGEVVNKRQVLGKVESGFLVITSYDQHVEYLRTYGDVVIIAGRETVIWGGKMPNAGKTQHLRFTGIWMKQDGRWQEIARHSNIMPRQE